MTAARRALGTIAFRLCALFAVTHHYAQAQTCNSVVQVGTAQDILTIVKQIHSNAKKMATDIATVKTSCAAVNTSLGKANAAISKAVASNTVAIQKLRLSSVEWSAPNLYFGLTTAPGDYYSKTGFKFAAPLSSDDKVFVLDANAQIKFLQSGTIKFNFQIGTQAGLRACSTAPSEHAPARPQRAPCSWFGPKGSGAWARGSGGDLSNCKNEKM